MACGTLMAQHPCSENSKGQCFDSVSHQLLRMDIFKDEKILKMPLQIIMIRRTLAKYFEDGEC